MKTVYAIRDRIANDLVGYYPLVVFRTDQQAIRYFADSIVQEKSALGAHPNDYELINIADIDDTGNITSDHGPSIVITGTAIMTMMTEHKES